MTDSEYHWCEICKKVKIVKEFNVCAACSNKGYGKSPAPDRPSLREVLDDLYTQGFNQAAGEDFETRSSAVNNALATLADYLTGAAPDRLPTFWNQPVDKRYSKEWTHGFNQGRDDTLHSIRKSLGLGEKQ